LPAAAWYVPIFCVRFSRATRGKTAHDGKGAHRSVEGTTRQLRKSYLYWALAAPNKYTVQVNEGVHIILAPEFLQYINHSCDPNIFFDTSRMELSCLKDISAGDELTFFYPSTEFEMESPFNCFCGSNNCLHKIQGAAFLSHEIIHHYKFTDFIMQKLNIPYLQKV